MRIISGLIGLSLILVGCSTNSQSDSSFDFAAQEINWDVCPTDYLLKKDFRAPSFDPAEVVCTELQVPVSYDDTTLGIKTIAMMGIGDAKKTAVFYNPGGPGASGIEAIQTIDFPTVLNEDYFVIGFDPRGVGFSSPVRCDDQADLESYYKYDLYIESKSEADEQESGYLKFVRDCAKTNPYWWTVTTANTVKDIELMREVLTKQPLNFIGSSYGTTLAMEYLRAYPNNVDKIMLDSPVLIGLDTDEDALQQGKGFNDSIERLFAKCAEDDNCLGNSVMEVAELIKEKLIAADEGKVLGYWGVQQSSINPDATVASANLILDGLLQMTYFEIDQVYEEFRRGLKDLIEENDSWIFEYYGLVYNGYDPETKERSNINEILYIVNCMDIDSREFDTEAEIDKFNAAYAKAAPLVDYLYTKPDEYSWVSERQGCEWSWLAFDDERIPDPPAKVPGPVNESGKQILIIASVGDSATPYDGAVKVAKELKSPLITYAGTGHAIAFNGNKCLSDVINEFFSSNTIPSDGLTCPED